MYRKSRMMLVLLITVMSIFAACGRETPASDSGEEADTSAATESAAEEADASTEAQESDGSYLDRALAGEFDGTIVTMSGPFVDEDAVKFNDSIAEFEAQTGIDIQYEGTKEFETTISVRVDAGDPPDIADFPQPGLLANFVSGGKVVDVSSFLDMTKLQENYLQSWLDMAMMEGPDGMMMAGVWARFNGKSLVWYPKDDFDTAGYEIPTTWEELIALTELIVEDGDTPWCIGIESGTATGWPATDWMEEIMLRTTSLDNYDKWTTGELPFSSPEVKRAAELMSEIWLTEGYVYGGRASIVSTSFADAPVPMFDDPPKCWLHKQGNFITSFFPASAEAGVDYDFFYLPPIDDEYGRPFLVAGDIYAMFNDRPEVRAVMEFFTTGESLKNWLASGGALSPHNDANLDWYGDDVERGIAALVQEADSVRFDRSDLMPGEVGAGSFWKGMTDYMAESVDLDTALEEIDAAWPR
ncbi:ABC transporter substrate-binding protein [Chloroflexi bacterium TSY]|nr:ABC transporter substrate-binding protein [Chloroflexi bacterium TSY]